MRDSTRSPLAVLALALFAPAVPAAPTLSAIPMGLPASLAGATLVGPVSTSTMLNMEMSLAPANRAGMEAAARAVSDPDSPDFHRFLSPADVGARFGASTTTVNAAVAYLKSKGMTVTMVADNRMAILFKGRVGDAESAFATKINRYRNIARTTPGPTEFFSYATPPKVPSNFAASVVTVQGLDSANPPIPRTSALRPQDARKVYNALPLYDGLGHKGEGIHVGISNFSGYRISNVAVFAQAFGLPMPDSGAYGSNVHKRIVGGVDGETVGEGAEGDLDFEMVLGIAPKADVYIYDGLGGGLIATLAQEVQDNVVDIVSESYGFGAGDDFYLAAHDQHLSMTLQGITYMGASGDSGTADLINDPYPDFDPDVLMVGGSDVTLNAAGARGTELGWNGSGSGWYQPSIAFNVLPPYQVGNGIPTNINKRLVPDLAVHATNWFFAFGNGIGNVGGTSAASPSFAGQLALILQTLAANNAVDLASNGRPRLGRIQDFIYKLNGDSTSFLDLIGGDAGVLPNGQESLGAPGWDFVTGLGAPDDMGLYNAYFLASSVVVPALADAATIYVAPLPAGKLGTSSSGTATNLTSADGVTYSIFSKLQNGVGQVAAAQITIQLQTAKTRRSATLQVALRSPKLTTGYVYLLNKNTNQYDLMQTVNGTGTMTTVAVSLDVSSKGTYIATDGTVGVLVRALKPSRLGSTPFTLDVDQAMVNERVPRG